MAASDDAVQHGGRWTLIDEEGNVQGSDSDIGSVSSSDCVAVEEDVVSYRAKRTNSQRSTGNSVSGSPPRNQIDHSTDQAQNVPTSSSWLGGFWTKNRSPSNSDSRLNESVENEPLPPVFQQEKDTLDTESLESIEVLSMPNDSQSDIDILPENQPEEICETFDPLGAVGTDRDRHDNVVKPMCSTNVVSSMDGLSPPSRVEDLTSSSNSSQLDFLIVNHQGPKNGAVNNDEAAANELPGGAVGGTATDEEDQMERSVGIAGPLPVMPPGQLPLSSVSVDNIPRGVEVGGSPRRAQSEGCITQQSERSSGVGVPIMTQRWPTEDGGFLLVQQFRGDGEPAMSRSSSFSDLSSSFSYPGVRRRIPTNSSSSLQRQSSETSSSEASHYNSDTSNDALPANMTVSGIKPGIRQYLHQRDESLNSKLTLTALIVITAAMALVLGHYIGSMQATSHHLGIEAGQVWRLRSLQDQLVTCLDKTKTLLRGAKGSTGISQAKATGHPDPPPSAKLPDPPDDVIQQSSQDGRVSCSSCTSGEKPQDRYSEFCNIQCKQNNDDKDLQESLSDGNAMSDNVLMLNLINKNSLAVNPIGSGVTGGSMPDVHTATQEQGELEAQAADTVIKSPTDDEGYTEAAIDMLPLSGMEPVLNDGSDDGLVAEEKSFLKQKHAVEDKGDVRGAENVPEIPEPKPIYENAPAAELDSSSFFMQKNAVESKIDVTVAENVPEIPGEPVPSYEDTPAAEVDSQNKGEEKFLDKEAEFSDSSSSLSEDDDVGSQEGTSDSPDDGNFMGKLSSKLSDSWFILRNITTDLVGSAANLSVNNVTTQLKENVETLRHQIKDAVSNLQKSNITSHLKDNVNSIGEHLKDAVSKIKEGNFSRTVKDTMQDLGEKVRGAVSGIKESNITSQIKEGLHGLGEKIQGAVSSVKESGSQLKKPFQKTMKSVKNLMKGKPVNSGKESNEEQSAQEDFIEPKKKPSANKKKRKSKRKSSEQVAKHKSMKKEAAKNRRKEERKKKKASQNDKKHKGERETNRRGNKDRDQTKNQQRKTKAKKEKSHNHNTDVKMKGHGKVKSHEKKPKPNQINEHAGKDNQQKKIKSNSREMLNDNKNSMKIKSEEAHGNDKDPKHRQEHSRNKSVPSRKRHGDINIERMMGVEETADLKLQPDNPKDAEEPPTYKERGYHKDDQSQKEKQFNEKKHQEERKHESKKSTHREHHQRKHSHYKETNDRHSHRHEDRKPGKDHQDKEDDARLRFEDIEWEDIFESFDVRCFGVRDCLRKQREAAVKLYEELLDYQDWLTKRCYKKHLEELKDFMEELEEFLAEPFLTDADLEELMEDFEDMAEDIEEETTKNFWKFMKSWTPRHKGGDESDSRDNSRRGSNKKKPTEEDKEKTLTITLDMKQTFNFSETVDDDVSESKDHRRHAGYGYQSNDDWFIRRMQDRENSRSKEQRKAPKDHQNVPNSNWYDHWMQGREEGRKGMTVWDLYQWFSKRQALRHEWRLHEMDDQSNWFLRRP